LSSQGSPRVHSAHEHGKARSFGFRGLALATDDIRDQRRDSRFETSKPTLCVNVLGVVFLETVEVPLPAFGSGHGTPGFSPLLIDPQ